MPAYWLARSTIKDPVEYKKYTDHIPSIMEKYNGRVMARGGENKVLEGETPYERFVVIEFDTLGIPEGASSSQHLMAYDNDGEVVWYYTNTGALRLVQSKNRKL